jgi:hypothetical protein
MTSEKPTEVETNPEIVAVEHPAPHIVGSDVEQAEDAIKTDQEIEQQATDPKVATEAGDAADVAETNLEDQQQRPGKVLDAIAAKVEDQPEEGQP